MFNFKFSEGRIWNETGLLSKYNELQMEHPREKHML